jgi:type I restriction enzyme M protein
MEHLWQEHGEKVYGRGFLKEHSKEILASCEDDGITLNANARSKLLDTKYWQQLKDLLGHARALMQKIGKRETSDYNEFCATVDNTLKAEKIKLSATEKNAILNAVSWYDEKAEKVIAKKLQLTASDLSELTDRLGCKANDLADFGYYKQSDGSYLTYESSSDLRDAESVPLKGSIHDYFLAEVKPHVDEAWVNLDSVKIGYEISFNKYFYQHKPLRKLEDVTADILALEEQADGLIADILGLSVSPKEVAA